MKPNRFVILLPMLLALISLQSCSKDPEACFSSALNGASATFSAACSAEATSWDWSFGDGSTSVLENPTHTYTTSGSYIVTLTVTSKKGKTNVTTETVTVDVCSGVACVNGDCVNGTCNCDPGYSGTDCGTAVNAKFSGTYNLSESCSVTGGGIYAITVAPKSASATEVTFQGLYFESQFVSNAVVGSDGLSFTLALQPVTTLTDRSISGSGTINEAGTTITITYSFWETSQNTILETCTGSMLRM